jgi:hypothetical protein
LFNYIDKGTPYVSFSGFHLSYGLFHLQKIII